MKSSLEVRSRKTTLHQLPVSEGIKEKLGKAGLDLKTMEAVYRRGGTKALKILSAIVIFFQTGVLK